MPARVTEVATPPVPDLRVSVEPDRGKLKFVERSVRYLAGFGTGVSYGVHADCLRNLVRGITERVLYVNRDGRLGKPPRPKDGVFERLASIRGRLLRKLPSTPVVDRDDFPALYSGRKRRVYQSAVDSLKLRGLTVADSYVSTFLKAEKVNFTSKGDPAPRVIQPRSPRYNVEVGRYLKLFEGSLCQAFSRCFGYPVVMKGMNAQQVGDWMHKHWTHFRTPVGVGLDASRFDQHVSRAALEWEHSIYNSHFRSDELRRLLRMQLVNRGIGRVEGHRVDYTVEGCRMSGDMNTGMGNCLLMSSIVIAYCESRHIDFRLANNGDDCVLFVEAGDLPALHGLDAWFLDFGFTLTREPPVYELEKVEFCQFQPVLTSTGWRMVRNPFTAMSKDCVSLVGWDTPSHIRAWATAVGECGLALTRGVPCWEAWYARLIRCGGDSNAGVEERIQEQGMYQWSKGVVGGVISPEARWSFYRAFGILPDAQEALEAEYALDDQLAHYTPVMCTHTSSIDNYNPLSLWRNQRDQ